MTHILDLFDLDELQAEIEAGYVQTRDHPALPLTIYTYTRSCQYDRRWNNVTMRCRGLIADNNGDIVAWPFPKFFNVSEHDTGQPYAPPLPDEPFTVSEKVDGSLGIVFWYGGKWHVASKGSFTSDQAVWANRWLDAHDTSRLDPNSTYLCEIVYPENRIVVRYDDSLTGLCLLGAYNTDGDEILLSGVQGDWEPVGHVVKQWAFNEPPLLSALLNMADDNVRMDDSAATGTNDEGWVIQFQPSGIRAKIKFAEYIRLHKIITGINARDIWQAYGADRFHNIDTLILADTIGMPVAEAERLIAIPGGAVKPLLENMPDEFDQWARNVMAELDRQYYDITQKIADFYAVAKTKTADECSTWGDERRAVFARHVHAITEDRTLRAGMFVKYNHKDIGPMVWKKLRPSGTDTFRTDEEG